MSTAIQLEKQLKGIKATSKPSVTELVKAKNNHVWRGIAHGDRPWILIKHASNSYTLKV